MQDVVYYKNAKISYSSKGTGSAVVLLHGFLENSTMWSEVSNQFNNKKVITIDLLGHGDSDCLGYIHSMDMMAEAVEAVLKQLKIRRAFFIGHSMGGYVALAFAEKFPQKIKGLCLMNSTATEDWKERKEFRDLAVKTAQKRFESVVKISVRNLFSEENQELLKPEIKEVVNEALKTSLQGYIAAQEGMKIRPNREHVLMNASFKTLQITGKEDDVICLGLVQKESIRTQTPLIILSNGHMSHIENKKELIVALKQFIR
jgi:pimeloyl-ACP methyl ester carboxylesterase